MKILWVFLTTCLLFGINAYGSAVATFQKGKDELCNDRPVEAFMNFSIATDEARNEGDLELTTRSRWLKYLILISNGQDDLASKELKQIKIEDPLFYHELMKVLKPHLPFNMYKNATLGNSKE